MKNKIIKIITLILSLTILASSLTLFGCGKEPDLRVYNCYEYIDESLIDAFETYYKEKTGTEIEVEYSCFDTPEDLYNKLKIDGSRYDLVCPSDYMIEKMAVEGMLEEITLAEDSEYAKNVSPFIKNTFDSITWEKDGQTKKLSQYAMGYMWGTLGLVYNNATVDANDMKSWSVLWEKYQGKFSIKDSVRDTYFIGLAKTYLSELTAIKGSADYTQKLSEIFNRTNEEAVNAVKANLFALKDKCYGLEVDEGKDQIIKGDIDVYFAWSGDAVYAMDTADEEGVTLSYSVPEEGSNVWFDGWCVPKGAKNKELAIEFANFLSNPQNAIQNMEYIGYVSCIAGNDIYNWVKETYGDDTGTESTDLSYFFGTGDYTVKYLTENIGRQFNAQYPSKQVIDRCAVMSYFDDVANERIMNMWTEVKTR